ncbi:MAG TPA: preprotein translocase subunit SecG [Pirellulales bacterium]|jgi:preprotein translocase subunit SecG|nr:preprotein translocase subunit SecG [Pirellulales bacterium]
MLNALIMILLFLTSTFLILLVLVQRGRGGGLAGAFGGLGGQSAFGTKAGDLFTRITIGVAAFWIILCAASVKLLSEGNRSVINLGTSSSTAAPTPKAGTAPAATGKATPTKSGSGPTASPAKPAAAEKPASTTDNPSEKAK